MQAPRPGCPSLKGPPKVVQGQEVLSQNIVSLPGGPPGQGACFLDEPVSPRKAALG